MKKLIYIVAFLSLPLIYFAQTNVEFEKKNFPDKKDLLKEAINEFKEGNTVFEGGENMYKAALPFYLKAQNFNPDNALLNYRIGLCYLNSFEHGKAFDQITNQWANDTSYRHPFISKINFCK